MAWYCQEATDEGKILSSRVRLARNLDKYPFKLKLCAGRAKHLVAEVANAAMIAGGNRFFHELDIMSFGEVEKKVFLEKHVVSPEFLSGSLPKGLLVSDDQNTSVMVNEEDHVRIQSISAGDNLAASYEVACHIDDLIEERLEYAFHADFGYLTSCPTNTGTGLRASYMIHLPCLDKGEVAGKLLPHVAKFGITLRGIYGEGTAPMGSIYQISNQNTLGKTEEDIMDGLRTVTTNVLEHEQKARDQIVKGGKCFLEDKVYRAHGILSNCRVISANEAMNLLSDIRLGFLTETLKKPRPNKQIYQIMMEIQPGHLQRARGIEMNDQDRDIARAEYLRAIFYSANGH